MTSTKGNLRRTLVRFQNEQARFKLSKSRVLRLTRKILSLLKLNAELYLVFVSDPQIRRINRRFHGTNRATDVLAFSNPSRWPLRKQSPRFLGEIIISVDRAAAYAKEFQVPRNEELLRYITHGVLHLIGESDAAPKARKKMFKRQEAIIKRLQPIAPLIR